MKDGGHATALPTLRFTASPSCPNPQQAPHRPARHPHRDRRLAGRHADGAGGAAHRGHRPHPRAARILRRGSRRHGRARHRACGSGRRRRTPNITTRSKAGSARSASAASSWRSSGAIPIFLGGDHSLSMGSVNGVARHWQQQGRPLFVLWLDAHADYNTPETTITGNMHGMSAAFLCRRARPRRPARRPAARARSARPTSNCSASARSIRWKRSWCASAASPSPTCARSTSSASAC